MHVIFTAYGDWYCVQRFLDDMKAQKHELTFTSPDGKEQKKAWMTAQFRTLPFGFYEYVFPSTDKDIVLTTFCSNKISNGTYSVNSILEDYKFMGLSPMKILKKALACSEIPEYKTESKFLWTSDNVHIEVIGIRYDKNDFVQPKGMALEGWTSEAI